MIYNSLYSGEEIDEAVGAFQNLKGMLSELIEILYPIGCIYVSTQSTNPADLFGGTWVQIKDTFLLTAGDTYTAGSTGGNTTHTHASAAHTHTTAGHTLTVDEIPSHIHNLLRQQWYNNDTAYNSGNIYNWRSGTGGTTGPRYTSDDDIFATGGGASHSHGDTGSTTPGATGSSSSLPPYRVVYAWERTA